MKRGWLAVALIVVAISISAAEYVYIGNNAVVCADMLNEADEHMEKNEIAQAKELMKRLDNRFSSQAGIYDVFLFHSEVMDISTGLAALRRYAQTGDVSEFLATSARVKRTLLSMHNTLIPSAENVF